MLKYTIATGKAETDILTTYGVHVSGSTGLVGRPDFKNPQKYNWDYLNGEWIDLQQRRYKPREIRLKCWLKANTKQAAIDNLNTFLKAFDTSSLIRLHVDFLQNNSGQVQTGIKGLFYLVYLSKTDSKNVLWRAGKQILTFDITLTEPSPIKRILMTGGTDAGTVTITYTSTSEFDIHWGDGNATYDCIGTSQTASHALAAGTHYIIITGNIGDISSMTVATSTPELTVTTLYNEI